MTLIHPFVMAGLVPAIHVVFQGTLFKTWMPATSAGMTEWRSFLRLERSRQQAFDRGIDRDSAAEDGGDCL